MAVAVLENLKDKLDIAEDEYNELECTISNIEKSVNAKGIFFDQQISLGFYSHMVSFIRRLKKKEMVEGADDADVVSQISQKNMESAKDIVETLCDKYEVKPNISEIVLIAIYLQACNQ